jgi:hypothetical protein
MRTARTCAIQIDDVSLPTGRLQNQVAVYQPGSIRLNHFGLGLPNLQEQERYKGLLEQ